MTYKPCRPGLKRCKIFLCVLGNSEGKESGEGGCSGC